MHLLVDVVAWTVLGILAGYVLHRAPSRYFERDNGLTRLRLFERGGRWYERILWIRRWKDRLPEAGNLFGGGFDKRQLASHSPEFIQRFVVETRRAELTHWSLLMAGPLFLLWNPPNLSLVMLAYALLANVPFVCVQRYNRARLERVLDTIRRLESSRIRGPSRKPAQPLKGAESSPEVGGLHAPPVGSLQCLLQRQTEASRESLLSGNAMASGREGLCRADGGPSPTGISPRASLPVRTPRAGRRTHVTRLTDRQ